MSSSFFLNQFVNLSDFPQILFSDSNTLCFEPIVNLVQFFEHLSPLSNCVPHFPHVVIKSAETVYIGQNVEIDPFVYIEGPVWIGDRAQIKQGAYLRPFSFIDQDAVVGHCSEIKRSILCRGAKAAHFNYVGDSLLGVKVNLGAGVKCANFRLDEKPIRLHALNQKLQTQEKKLGAIIGSGASIGCNSVLSPGSLINPYTKIPPNTHVRGYL